MRTTITADVPGGGDQVTTYTYGTTKGVSAGDSEIATGHLLQKVAYPDSTGSSDTVTYAYDAQGRQDWMKDQSGNIIETTFDNAGRETSRAVTTLASGFNGDVRRIETSYTNRGQVENVTQYDAASSGSIVDEVEYAYTRHGGVEYFYQDMNSAVNTGAGDHYSIQYGWELSTGGRESWRRTGVILPSGNTLTYQYSSGIDDEVSRLSIIKDDSLRLAEYDYLGYTRVVGQTYAIPDLMQEYYGSTSGDYSGFDRFGRVVRSRWQRDTGSGDIDVYDVELAYDRNSNITLAEDAIIPGRDVEYTMDSLNRLVQAEEGTWSGSAITSKTRDEEWTLDHLGNWDSHQLDLDGDGSYGGADELDETRTHNAVNELLTRDLDGMGGADETLTYNAVGQLTDDDSEWEYVYDAFGRLCEVKNQSSALVAEYRYNGLGFQIGELTDTNVDSYVNGSDTWHYSAFDERWRKLATFKGSITSPFEEFVPHNAGLNGGGGSSYINDTVLRDKDVDEDVNHILEQRIFYLNNWRGDVVGLVTSTGYQGEFVRYSAYGTPFNYPGGDANSDGETNAADGTVISGWVSGMAYDLRGDLDLDGDVDASDSTAFSAAYTGSTGGRGALSGQGSWYGYAGMGWATSSTYLSRNRRFRPLSGAWSARDHVESKGSFGLYQYVWSRPMVLVDHSGLSSLSVTQPPPSDPVVSHPIEGANLASVQQALQMLAAAMPGCSNAYGDLRESLKMPTKQGTIALGDGETLEGLTLPVTVPLKKGVDASDVENSKGYWSDYAFKPGDEGSGDVVILLNQATLDAGPKAIACALQHESAHTVGAGTSANIYNWPAGHGSLMFCCNFYKNEACRSALGCGGVGTESGGGAVPVQHGATIITGTKNSCKVKDYDWWIFSFPLPKYSASDCAAIGQ